jgi:hypothetical protein
VQFNASLITTMQFNTSLITTKRIFALDKKLVPVAGYKDTFDSQDLIFVQVYTSLITTYS